MTNIRPHSHPWDGSAWTAGTPAGIGGEVERIRKSASRGAGGPWYAGTPAGIGGEVEKNKKICQKVADPGHEVRREGWRSMVRRHPCRHRWRSRKNKKICQKGCWRSDKTVRCTVRRHPCRHRWRSGKNKKICQQRCWRSDKTVHRTVRRHPCRLWRTKTNSSFVIRHSHGVFTP